MLDLESQGPGRSGRIRFEMKNLSQNAKINKSFCVLGEGRRRDHHILLNKEEFVLEIYSGYMLGGGAKVGK